MSEYKCGDCNQWFRGVPIDRLTEVAQLHDQVCTGKSKEVDPMREVHVEMAKNLTHKDNKLVAWESMSSTQREHQVEMAKINFEWAEVYVKTQQALDETVAAAEKEAKRVAELRKLAFPCTQCRRPCVWDQLLNKWIHRNMFGDHPASVNTGSKPVDQADAPSKPKEQLGVLVDGIINAAGQAATKELGSQILSEFGKILRESRRG